MGKPVTVDSDDLEKLIMLSSATKEIEKILYQQKGDPFVCKDETKIKTAHERIAGEWRRATREMNPASLLPVSSKAYTLLKSLQGHICQIEHATMRLPLYQELWMKLLIEYGNGHEMIYWSSTQEVQKVNELAAVVVRVTPAGSKLLLDMETKDKSTLQ